MFGISLGEILIILIIALVVIGPKDLPQVLKYCARALAKLRKFSAEIQAELKQTSREIGVEEIKSQLEKEITEHKASLEKEITTTIIDIYGNEHRIPSIEQIRNDLSKEELIAEIARHNQLNSNKKNNI